MESNNSDAPAWAEYEKRHPIKVPANLEHPHPITRMTAAAMGWPIPDPHDPSQLARRDWFNVSIRETNPHRVLRLIDTLLKACEARGFDLRHEREGGGIAVIVAGEAFRLELSEQASAPHRLALRTAGRTWNDTLSRRLERRLNNVMLVLRSAAAQRIACRQQEEKIAQMERRRAELRQQVAEERADVDALFTEAQQWRKAQDLRAYIAAVEALPVARKDRKKRANWVAWAYEQADRQDPLTSSPPSILDMPKREYRELQLHEVLNEDGEIELV